MAVRLLGGTDRVFWTILSTLTALSASTLICLGFRQRSGCVTNRGLLAVASLSMLICYTLVLVFSAEPVHHPIVSTYVVAMLGLSIRALMKGREEDLASAGMTIAMMTLFIAFFIFLTILGLLTRPWGMWGPDLYRAVYLLGVPASLVGVGLFALLLLAEDLAHGMKHLAIIDPLTGLLNRRGFDEAARRLKAECRRASIPVSVAVMDRRRAQATRSTIAIAR